MRYYWAALSVPFFFVVIGVMLVTFWPAEVRLRVDRARERVHERRGFRNWLMGTITLLAPVALTVGAYVYSQEKNAAMAVIVGLLALMLWLMLVVGSLLKD